jgi:hypothetical protein
MSLGQRALFTGGKFSSAAVFQLSDSTATIKGVFDDGYYNAALGENILEGATPRLTVLMDATGKNILDVNGDNVPFNAAGGIVRETPLTLNGGTYSVLQVQPDLGTGMAVIDLAPY